MDRSSPVADNSSLPGEEDETNRAGTPTHSYKQPMLLVPSNAGLPGRESSFGSSQVLGSSVFSSSPRASFATQSTHSPPLPALPQSPGTPTMFRPSQPYYTFVHPARYNPSSAYSVAPPTSPAVPVSRSNDFAKAQSMQNTEGNESLSSDQNTDLRRSPSPIFKKPVPLILDPLLASSSNTQSPNAVFLQPPNQLADSPSLVHQSKSLGMPLPISTTNQHHVLGTNQQVTLGLGISQPPLGIWSTALPPRSSSVPVSATSAPQKAQKPAQKNNKSTQNKKQPQQNVASLNVSSQQVTVDTPNPSGPGNCVATSSMLPNKTMDVQMKIQARNEEMALMLAQNSRMIDNGFNLRPPPTTPQVGNVTDTMGQTSQCVNATHWNHAAMPVPRRYAGYVNINMHDIALVRGVSMAEVERGKTIMDGMECWIKRDEERFPAGQETTNPMHANVPTISTHPDMFDTTTFSFSTASGLETSSLDTMLIAQAPEEEHMSEERAILEYQFASLEAQCYRDDITRWAGNPGKDDWN